MQAFANRFYAANNTVLKPYLAQWGHSPLLNWSRQFEYPYVDHMARAAMRDSVHGQVHILDAGSGCSFFPYLLTSESPNAFVSCVDSDDRLKLVFESIASEGADRVWFRTGDLRRLDFETHSFDLIYCVSVLEHTNSYDLILDEFLRVLKPGGRLVLTIDVAIDGANEIPVHEAAQLLELVNSRMEPLFEAQDLSEQVTRRASELLTTRWCRDHNSGILPWRFLRLSALRAGLRRGRLSWFPNLAIHCGSWSKK